MDWDSVSHCFLGIPGPLFKIDVYGDQLPIIEIPEEHLSKGLRDRGVRIFMPLGFMLSPGTLKSVPAGYMLDCAIEEGIVVPGKTPLVESTSGGMGAALAYHGKRRGVQIIAIIPENLPRGKRLLLERLGAIALTEQEALDRARLARSPGSMALAAAYAEATGAVYLNQYAHPWNPESYEALVAPKLWDGLVEHSGGGATLFASGVGSRGTILGLGRAFRERNPSIRIVGVMPYHDQGIDGTRTWARQTEVKHRLEALEPKIFERIDEAAVAKYAERLRRMGIPAGRSGAATFGSIEHILLTMVEEGTLDELRNTGGAVRVIAPIHDHAYLYDAE